MMLRNPIPTSQRFVQLYRPLRDGESIPNPPSLIEQVMACRMEPPVDLVDEPEGDPEYWDLEADEDEE